jgi:hypothetical protein
MVKERRKRQRDKETALSSFFALLFTCMVLGHMLKAVHD